jgi:hypothetical protein
MSNCVKIFLRKKKSKKIGDDFYFKNGLSDNKFFLKKTFRLKSPETSQPQIKHNKY